MSDFLKNENKIFTIQYNKKQNIRYLHRNYFIIIKKPIIL